MWNINPAIYNEANNKYILQFSAKDTNTFLSIIKDYVPACMGYKLGPFKKENLERLKREREKKIKCYKEYLKRNYEKEWERWRRYRKENKEKIKAYRRKPDVMKRHREYMRMYRLKHENSHYNSSIQ